MAVTAAISGTLSATQNFEHVIYDATQAGTYTFHMDMVNMTTADMIEARVYQMILTGGTRRVAYYEFWVDDQPSDSEIKISVPVSTELTDTGSLRFSIKAVNVAGTPPRSVPYKVLRYA